MQVQSVVDRIARRAAGIDRDVVRQVVELCEDLDPALVEGHFSRVREPSRYLRDFDAEDISAHLRLLRELLDEQMVVASAQPNAGGEDFDVIVAGIDMVGVSACVTGCLAELGLQITRMDVVTYEPHTDAARSDAPPDRYVMAFRVMSDEAAMNSAALTATLTSRLKAAYWHLVRGDVHRARHASDDQDEMVGRTIDGRYRIERHLARGGMGRLYLATQLDLGREVVVKMIRPELTRDEAFVDDFRREARLLAQVNSPHVVHVYAAGLFEERCWMALEYMAGGDVEHWTMRRGAPPRGLATRWLADALAGLQYVHRDVGMLHRDIKPNNLLLDVGKNLKIGDLGLSQLQRLADLTKPDGTVRGTPWFMSPEQARGGRLDGRSDLFSLGSSFYYILTGTRPFDGATTAEIVAKVARADFVPLSRLAPEVPAALSVVVDRLMQPDPERRYQAARVALADVNSYIARGLLSKGEAATDVTQTDGGDSDSDVGGSTVIRPRPGDTE